MADTKITALTAIGANPVNPATFPLPMVDLVDTTMAASGTTKKVTVNQILGAGGTATLASATITGDLTVDTNVLKVDSANNRVGIGTATPALPLDVVGGIQVTSGSAGGLYQLAYGASASSRSWRAWNDVSANGDFQISTSTTRTGSTYSDRYRIDVSGVHEWSNTSGLAMTLNSTGLGVGGSPASGIKLNVHQGGSTSAYLKISNGDTGSGTGDGLDIIVNNAAGNYKTNFLLRETGAMAFWTDSTERLLIDATGNVGVGVTPSAWTAGFKALQVGVGSALWTNNAITRTSLSANYYYSGGDLFLGNGYAHGYWQDGANGHRWFTSNASNASGAGAAATMTEMMRLTASGDLLVGTTNSASNAGIGLKAAYSATAPYYATVGSSNASNAYSYLLYSTTDAAFKFYVSYSGTVSATNGTISAISDSRLKENVQDIDVGLGAILALKPRKFDWKAGKGKDIKGDRGFIAQEFEQVFPNLVDEWKDNAPEGEAPYKSVRQDLIPVLVKAIQELTARVQTLEAK